MRGMFFALSDGSNPVTYAYKKMMRERQRSARGSDPIGGVGVVE